VRGFDTVDLRWSGATSSGVDIYRDGAILALAVPNNPQPFTDNTNQKGPATFIYHVCNAGTETCSNNVTVNF
jgi:serine protease